MISWGNKLPLSVMLASTLLLAAPSLALAEGADGADAAAPAAASGADAAAPAAASGSAADGAPAATATSGEAAGGGAQDQARDALKQKSSDASNEKNLQQVFEAAQKEYSLLKAGRASMTYSVSYSYFRNSAINVALSQNSSQITQFQILDNAQHTINNDFNVDYGVKDNLTFDFDTPFVSELDTTTGVKVTNLGDVSFGLRWQPFPLKTGLPTTTLFGTLSTATGSSPYKIDLNNDLATGKGFYSMSGGASVSKVIDPVVLFASASYTYGLPINGIDQRRGSQILRRVVPGDGVGISFGMAYSLNYDVSVSSSVQVSAGMPTRFEFADGTIVNSADSVTSTFNAGLSLRTSPTRIVNLSFGFGLTPDSPNVILGFNVPVDIAGFTTTGQ